MSFVFQVNQREEGKGETLREAMLDAVKNTFLAKKDEGYKYAREHSKEGMGVEELRACFRAAFKFCFPDNPDEMLLGCIELK